MPRLASLFLPQLAIERIVRAERREGPRDPLFPPQMGEGEGGLKPGHWRPGARWAREAAVRAQPLSVAEGALVTATVSAIAS